MSKLTKLAFNAIDILVVFVMTFASPMSALAAVWTDWPDYPPGSEVLIQGDNSNGVAYQLDAAVHVDVVGPNGYTSFCDTTVTQPDPNNPDYLYWSCSVTLWDSEDAVGEYTFTARSGDVIVIGTFTDSLPADATVNLSVLQPDGSPSSGEIGGVKFSNVKYSAGTGVIDPFVRIQGTNQTVEQGYNSSTTSSSPDPQFQETGKYGSQYNHALALNDIPIAYIYDYTAHQFVAYRQFLLDINETSDAKGQQYLSMEALQIYQSNSDGLYAFTGSPTTTGTFSGGTSINLIYNMDADDVGNWVALNYDLNPGSGYGDVSVYVPDSFFNSDPYVYLYSAFGDENKNQEGYLWEFSDGFEEWSRGVGVPRAVSDLTGSKFFDANGDGVFDEADGDLAWTPANGFETPVIVYLDQNKNGVLDWTDGNSNGTWDPGEGERWTTTDSDGNYTFTQLPAGLGADSTYYVRELVPTGYAQTAPLDGDYDINGDPVPPSTNPVTSTVSGYTITVQINTADTTYVLPAFGNKIDVGSLKLTKSLTGGPDGYTGPFTLVYDCDGTDYDGSVEVYAGSSETIGGIPAGTSCTISEPTLPTPPDDYSFGTPTFSPSATVVISAGTTVEVTTNNTLTRDQGYLKISKIFDSLTSGFTGTFAINYSCDNGNSGTVNLAAGASTTVGPFLTGTSCTVSEPTLPDAPDGWTFGTPSISGSPATIVKGDEAAAVEVTVTNSITKDRGTFTVLKTLTNNDNAPVPTTFEVTYDCGLDTDGLTELTDTLYLVPGVEQTVSGIPTGNTCSVTEATLTPIPSYTWGTVSYTPTSIEIGNTTDEFKITVGNSITRDLGSLKIVKTVTDPTPLPTGFSRVFEFDVDCTLSGSPDLHYDLSINYPTTDFVTQSNIPTLYSCTVSEAQPTAYDGYAWATPVISGSPALISKDTTVTVTAKNRLLGHVNVEKLMFYQDVPSDAYIWNFGIYSGPNELEDSSFLNSPLATDSAVYGDKSLDFGNYDLDPNQTYTLCELGLPAGWASFWRIDTDNDGIADATVIPYNPNESDDPPEDIGNRCYDFTVGAASTLVFEIENKYPGGEPRTPGYWKNWNRVTGGGQAENADRNGGWEAGFWLLEDVLDPNVGGGITWDDILSDGFVFPITDAAVAVDILDQREIGDPDTVGDGVKHANDAAYTLVMHLLAAQLNFGASARTCDEALDAALQAETLLDEYDFDGTSDYLLNTNKKVKADYNKALQLASLLDLYNNGDLCVGPAVNINNPTGGTIFTDSDTSPVTIVATVLDTYEVLQVEFFIDGVSLGVDTDGSDGWTMDWDWNSAGEGSHTIEAIATNNQTENNTGSADVVVYVDLVPDVPMHVESLTESTEPGKGGKWTATVTVEIVSGIDPVAGATVSGIWDGGVVGNCLTNTSGECDISITNNKNISSVTFTVTNVTHATFVYNPGANLVDEITISAP